MDLHGRQSIPSPEIGQIWSYTRDNLKGTTPLAQEQIECLQRDYLPPSKAHIKRLKKQRPLVLRARPQSIPDRDIGDFNHAKRLGDRVRLLNKRVEYGTHSTRLLARVKAPPPVAFDYTRNATVPKETQVFDAAYYAAESARIGREMDAERARVEALKHV